MIHSKNTYCMVQFKADLLFAIHLLTVAIILFGWAIFSIRIMYLTVIFLTLVSEIYLSYCPLTKWEFDLRKKHNPNLNYDYAFLNYYGYS